MDRETIDKLIDAHEGELYRYVKYLGADHARAEDVMQDTFLAAYRSNNPPPADDVRRRGAWLRGIARNIFLTHCRKAKRNPVRANSDALEQAEAYWTAALDGPGDFDALHEALDACLAETSERNRKILRMKYIENCSRAEIAASLGMNEEGVKTALRRTREHLAGCIRRRRRREERS